ncbi:Homeobox-leucine zipper protein HAT4 [Frankliniella fusca]|uniref:Homeobox-leucine zipper protein HAT4 n=1 Tax=Frankliniella fusca TaxID=407009 RepID=A0AAE1HJ36_9NEOP|nr:Homeobox-leucine zipper protein HAT4 [Frankliniella fusca]
METCSCVHPVDSSRSLYFASDFPHLVKNMWTRIISKQELNLPEGTIKLDHWRAVLDNESGKGIKAELTLSKDHLQPTNFQKMKVRLAMQAKRVAVCTEHYRALGDSRLKDAEPTIEFIR